MSKQKNWWGFSVTVLVYFKIFSDRELLNCKLLSCCMLTIRVHGFFLERFVFFEFFSREHNFNLLSISRRQRKASYCPSMICFFVRFWLDECCSLRCFGRTTIKFVPCFQASKQLIVRFFRTVFDYLVTNVKIRRVGFESFYFYFYKATIYRRFQI